MLPRFSTLILVSICVLLAAAIPASAGVVYQNGPINGGYDAWTINQGFIVSDSFTVSGGNATITGLSFGVWLFVGDQLNTVEVSLTSNEFGGTVYFDQTVSFTTSNCGGNDYGLDVCTATGNFNGPNLANGTYWLNLQNATTVSNNGDPIYWDENRGPSMASENVNGPIPSESFTLYGNAGGTVPEPGSLPLVASGVIAIAAVVRRRLW